MKLHDFTALGNGFHRPLNGPFQRGRCPPSRGGALKQPIKKPTETPTSTLALMGRFPSLMGRFPTLMGRFTDFVLRGRSLPLENPLENSPLRKWAGTNAWTYGN